MFKEADLIQKSDLSKKIKKAKFDVKNVGQVLTISFPEEIPADSKKYKRRFKVGLRYKDKVGKERMKTIYFGDKGVSEFIDHKRDDLRQITMGKMRPGKHLFDKEYYRYHLLNGPKPTLLGNYTVMLHKIKIENE
jgi:hypothetical protein